MLRQRRPAGTEIVSRCGLAASMQHDDERRTVPEVLRDEREQFQRPWIAAKAGRLDEWTINGGREASPIGFEALKAIQLRKASQKIDILR